MTAARRQSASVFYTGVFPREETTDLCIKRFETEIVTLFLLFHFIYKRRGVKQV